MTTTPLLAGLEIVDLRRRRDEALLEAAYRDLYLPAFPIASERESPDIWRHRLWGGDRTCELHFLVAGFRLREPGRRRLVGAGLFEHYARSATGLDTYLVVHPDWRGRGPARLLWRRGRQALGRAGRRAGRPLRALFVEVHDPRRLARARDSMDPWARLRVFERLGGRVLDLPYVQPALAPGQGRVRALLLLAVVGRGGVGPPGPVVRGFLRDLYRSLGIRRPEADPDFRRMSRALGRGPTALTEIEEGGRRGRPRSPARG